MNGRAPCAGVLVLSDKGSRGERVDTAGPALVDFLNTHDWVDARLELLPDDRAAIAATLRAWCDEEHLDLILTCGGTGVSPRDVTPEATREVIERELPGFGERMRAVSHGITPHALVSRALAGTRGHTLIINLPGSPRAAVENLSAVWAAVPHLIAKLRGDPADCAPDVPPTGT